MTNSDRIHNINPGFAAVFNHALRDGFQKHALSPQVRRSHLFNNRYENIYLTSNEIPELEILLSKACEIAVTITGASKIKAGCWFNAMPPGAVTTRHSHDDDDELLSGVYYVQVPPDSGDLILYDDEPPTRITPVAGQMIFFPPDIDHEVTRNNSSEDRLSIGMNFGPIHKD
jgi:uncharacterized RmlC-like cupin family protein